MNYFAPSRHASHWQPVWHGFMFRGCFKYPSRPASELASHAKDFEANTNNNNNIHYNNKNLIQLGPRILISDSGMGIRVIASCPREYKTAAISDV